MKRIGVIFTLVAIMVMMSACQASSSADEDSFNETAKTEEKTVNEDEQNRESAHQLADGANDESPDQSAEEESQEVTSSSGNAKQAGTNSEEGESSEVREADSEPLTREEAEELVRRHLDLDDSPEVNVRYDHEEEGKYVIQVFEIVGQGEDSHSATLGWYYVDPRTQEIESMF